jgi:two-component system alkaline phosphatase synthesis response regulator PhoP/two-component system response regulator ResD
MTQPIPTILLVDDEPTILELNKAGYRTVSAATGHEAVAAVKERTLALMVLDLMLPGIDGWEVCRQVRALGNLPIIMLTARSEDIDRIVGLELGADDYLTKPYNPRELLARVKAVLRRSSAPPETVSERTLGDVTLDTDKRSVSLNGESLPLRAKEFELLAYLFDHVEKALTREQLLEQVWGFDFYGESRTVDVHVAAVRKALTGSRLRIETVWGIGYRLIVEKS